MFTPFHPPASGALTCLRRLLLAALISACSASGAAELLFLAPKGSDTATGRSNAEALATFGKAMQVAMRSKDPEGTTILVAPGTYTDQSFVMRLVGPVPPITIRRAVANEAAVFDGVDNRGSWLRVRSTASMPLQLTIEGMSIRRYGMAISLEGPPDTPNGISGMRVLDNRIEEIGTPGPPPATAALRLTNAQDVKVVGNTFRKIRNFGTNAPKDCVLLHPIYAAHNASRNTIENNIFDDNCGVAIKFRDGSDNNLIARNVFRNQALESRMQDWYCDSSRRKDCLGERDSECPSWNNRFVDNRDGDRPTGLKALDIRGGQRGFHASCPIPRAAQRVLTR